MKTNKGNLQHKEEKIKRRYKQICRGECVKEEIESSCILRKNSALKYNKDLFNIWKGDSL